MDIHQQIPLKNYLTMKLGGPARFMLDIHTTDELLSAHRTATAQHTPIFILGGGSNVIARDEGFAGIVLRMRIPGFEVLADDLHTTTIKVGAGEIWDSVVQRTVEMRLGGIEAMSAIPGTAGAAPVQNIGAYGQEVSDTLVSLEAYDSVSDRVVTLINNDCGFAYRQSIFRTTEIGRYVILNITLRLSKNLPAPPFYSSLQAYLDTHHVTSYTHQAIREAVTAIRADKLPDPAVKPNSGW
jgi:UDP-N-acetylmuramate dehydrogenase